MINEFQFNCQHSIECFSFEFAFHFHSTNESIHLHRTVCFWKLSFDFIWLSTFHFNLFHWKMFIWQIPIWLWLDFLFPFLFNSMSNDLINEKHSSTSNSLKSMNNFRLGKDFSPISDWKEKCLLCWFCLLLLLQLFVEIFCEIFFDSSIVGEKKVEKEKMDYSFQRRFIKMKSRSRRKFLHFLWRFDEFPLKKFSFVFIWKNLSREIFN